MAHVFIVDETTFSTHLKYMFAGTGAKEYKCNYLEDDSIEIKAPVERLLSEMISDISRVKKGDSVIFYLRQTKKDEGKFFGSFKVKDEPFLCNDDFLKNELGKNLTFRVNLIPDEVYKEGITERECLDSLKNINHPSQMCWSLIYRKLKGNRGCTMITNYEYDQIMKKIKQKNNNKTIESKNFNYDKEHNQIIPFNEELEYTGRKEKLDVTHRLINKINKRNAYEALLQAHILQNILTLDSLKINEDKITWIGNEVSCGIGMQSIDICFIQENDKEANIAICEIKDEELYKSPEIKNQIEKYINWMIDYIVPTYKKKVILHPIIITSKVDEKESKNGIIKNNNLYKELKQQFKRQKVNSVEIAEIKFIEFGIFEINGKKDIKFERKDIDD
jgi:hypothetical protein